MRKHPAVYPAVHRFHFLFIGLLVFLLHGAKLNSDIIGIDTEDIIHLQDGFYGGWLQTGRQGLVLLKYLPGNGQFNPYYSGLITLLLFSASVAAFFLLWDEVGDFSGGQSACSAHGRLVRQAGGLFHRSFRQVGGMSGRSDGQVGGRSGRSDRQMGGGSGRSDRQIGDSFDSAEGQGGIHLDLWAWVLGGLLWVSHPVMAEQFYFSLQSMEICACLLLTALALYLSFCWAEMHRPLQAAGGVLLLLLTFSSYQIFVVLYIFGTVSIVLLQALRDIRVDSCLVGTYGSGGALGAAEADRTEELTAGSLLKRVIPYFLIFLAAFLLNTLITQFFFSSSGYLQNQFFWGQASWKDCIFAIGAHIVKVFTGLHSVFYQAGFGVLALLDFGLLTVFLHGFCKGRRGIVCVAVFFYLSLLASPFLMTLLLGGAPAVRSQLVLPAVTGFLGYLGVWLCEGIAAVRAEAERCADAGAGVGEETGPGVRRRAETGPEDWSREEEWSGVRSWTQAGAGACGRHEIYRAGMALLLAAVCLVGGMEQAKVTGSLYYTDRCRYEQDAALGRAVIQRVRQVSLGDDGVPVIVVGHKSFTGNNACVMGEVIGRSFFDYDTEVEPISFWSTRRVLGFLHILGAEFSQAPEERIEEALEYSTYMPEWPAEESVQEKDGMIIIKLSHYE